MNADESLNRPPLEEIAKRVSEAATGLATAAHGVALHDYIMLQRGHRRRLDDSHRAGMEVLGFNPDDRTPNAEDDMGDIIVTGDVYGDRAIDGLQRQSPSTGPKPLGLLGKLIVAAALLAGGAGVGLLANQLLSSDYPPASVDTDTTTDVTFPD